jgi:hypothetical protein
MLTLIPYRLKLATARRLLPSLSPFLPFKVSTVCSNGMSSLPFPLFAFPIEDFADAGQSHP